MQTATSLALVEVGGELEIDPQRLPDCRDGVQILYSQSDRDILREFQLWLRPLQRRWLVNLCSDEQYDLDRLSKEFERAQVIVLILSSRFFSSSFFRIDEDGGCPFLTMLHKHLGKVRVLHARPATQLFQEFHVDGHGISPLNFTPLNPPSAPVSALGEERNKVLQEAALTITKMVTR